MKNIGYIIIIALLFISCGTKSIRNQSKTKDQSTISQVPKEYGWHQPINAYHGQKMELYGFVWFDTIEGICRNGQYIIYEKPNCYQCKEVNMQVQQDLVLIDLIDTSYVPDSVSPQWRLIKVTGMVNQNNIEPDKIERSVYSYPDYENSGYQKITDAWLASSPSNGDYVYVDGIIKPDELSFMDGYAHFSISGTGLKSSLSIYIKKGQHNDQAEEGKNNNGPIILKVNDQRGNAINNKKVRLYGVWKNFIQPEEAKASGMVFVESIKLL